MSIANRAMGVVLQQGIFEARKTASDIASDIENEYGAEAGAFNVTKRLIPPMYLKNLRSIRTGMRTDHLKYTIATDRENFRLLPTVLYLQHAARFAHWSDKQITEVRNLQMKWDYIKNVAAPKFLGRALVEGELPSESMLPSYFRLDISYHRIPENFSDWRLDGIAPDEMEHLQNYTKNDTEYMFHDAARALYKKAETVVSRFIDIAKGESCAVKANTMDNLAEFADLLAGMNIFNDEKLAEASEGIKKLVKNTAEAIRNDEAIRGQSISQAERIKGLLSKFGK